LQEAKGNATSRGYFRETKRPHKFSNYVALMSKIIDSKPSTYEEFAKKKVLKDAMMEEYQSIMNNDVWEVVLRPEGKSVVNSTVDIQDQACCRWKHREVQSEICG
jgi:hypothetical protein